MGACWLSSALLCSAAHVCSFSLLSCFCLFGLLVGFLVVLGVFGLCVSVQVHPEVMLTDTVGFIQKLPTNLVAAFRATLEEVSETVWCRVCACVRVYFFCQVWGCGSGVGWSGAFRSLGCRVCFARVLYRLVFLQPLVLFRPPSRVFDTFRGKPYGSDRVGPFRVRATRPDPTRPNL